MQALMGCGSESICPLSHARQSQFSSNARGTEVQQSARRPVYFLLARPLKQFQGGYIDCSGIGVLEPSSNFFSFIPLLLVFHFFWFVSSFRYFSKKKKIGFLCKFSTKFFLFAFLVFVFLYRFSSVFLLYSFTFLT